MARIKRRPFTRFDRGKAVWIWWPDGKGGKHRKRVLANNGAKVTKDFHEEEILKSCQETYTRWTRAYQDADCSEEAHGLTIGELVGLYVEASGKHWKCKTLLDYHSMLELLYEYFGRDSDAGAVDVHAATNYMGTLREDRINSGATDRKYLGLYSSIFKFGVAAGYLKIDPFSLIKSKYRRKNRPNPDPFSPDEVKLLLTTAKTQFAWFYPALVFASLTGMHQCELIGLKVCDFVDSPNGAYLNINDDIAKWSLGRKFYITDSTHLKILRDITAHRQSSEPLFVNQYGRKLASNTFNTAKEQGRSLRAWSKLLECAGVRPRRFNCLRQAVDTNLTFVLGFSSSHASKYVGHSQRVSEKYYQARLPELTVEGMKNLSCLYGVTTHSDLNVEVTTIAERDCEVPCVPKGRKALGMVA